MILNFDFRKNLFVPLKSFEKSLSVRPASVLAVWVCMHAIKHMKWKHVNNIQVAS